MTKNTLYVVATPIGNLDDISRRAIDTLKQVDVVAAEDTRHSRRLLDHLGIRKPMMAIHDHNERSKIDQVIELLSDGQSVALVSDAGTPLISDPGYPLVNACRDKGVNVIPLPGPCALITALSAAGLPTDRFIFEGFLPAKSKARRERLQEVLEETRTLVYYESTHRILNLLEDLADLMPERRVVLARELTKRFETFLSGRAAELKQRLEEDSDQTKGEFVVMLAGAEPIESEGLTQQDQYVLKTLMEALPLKKAAQMTANLTGKSKNALYQLGLTLKDNE